jgi:hypothetical protein
MNWGEGDMKKARKIATKKKSFGQSVIQTRKHFYILVVSMFIHSFIHSVTQVH